jgi:multidrug efflux pump subunit AcrA (membrane-fusion protein)
LDAYTKHIDELRVISDPSSEQLRQIADALFNIADCYEQTDDLSNAGQHLSDAVSTYKTALEKSKSEKEKMLIRSQLNVLSASMMRIDGRKATASGDYEAARQMLEKSLSALDEALGKGWDKDYENFLRGLEKETKDLLGSLKSKSSKVEKEAAELKDAAAEKMREEDAQLKGEEAVRRAEAELHLKAEEERTKLREAEDLRKSEELSGEELARLLAEKDSIEKKIEAVKRRYSLKQVDETVFKDILGEYEKLRAELDARIGVLRGGKEKTQ